MQAIPNWLITIITSFGLAGLKMILKALELKYPGLAPVIDKILELLNGGKTCDEVSCHLDLMK